MCLHIYEMSSCVYIMTRHVFIYLDMFTHIFVIPMVLSMAPLHLLGHSDESEVKHPLFSHLVQLLSALPSCDENCTIKGTIFSFCEETWNKVWHVSLIMWCCWDWCEHQMTLVALSMAPFCLLGHDDQNKVQHDFFGHVSPGLASHDIDDINNSIPPFLSSRWLKWDEIIIFQSFDTVGTGIIWFQWHHCIVWYSSYQGNCNNVQHNFLFVLWCK